MDKIINGIQMMCGDSYIKWFELCFLIGIFLLVLLFPIFRHIEWKLDCRKYGEETAYEIWRRYK